MKARSESAVAVDRVGDLGIARAAACGAGDGRALAELLRRAARAAARLHAAGATHGDLKPQNVIVAFSAEMGAEMGVAELVLVDLERARIAGARRTGRVARDL